MSDLSLNHEPERLADATLAGREVVALPEGLVPAGLTERRSTTIAVLATEHDPLHRAPRALGNGPGLGDRRVAICVLAGRRPSAEQRHVVPSPCGGGDEVTGQWRRSTRQGQVINTVEAARYGDRKRSTAYSPPAWRLLAVGHELCVRGAASHRAAHRVHDPDRRPLTPELSQHLDLDPHNLSLDFSP